MTAINEILLPVLLFVIYFSLAIQFLQQQPPTATISDRPNAIEEQVNPVLEIIQARVPVNDPVNAVMSRDRLETQSLANLKAIAAELCIIYGLTTAIYTTITCACMYSVAIPTGAIFTRKSNYFKKIEQICVRSGSPIRIRMWKRHFCCRSNHGYFSPAWFLPRPSFRSYEDDYYTTPPA